MKDKKVLQSGITLIALIITIIVMLILVAVTVRTAVNSGLFGHAKNATEQWAAEEKKELNIDIPEEYLPGNEEKNPENNRSVLEISEISASKTTAISGDSITWKITVKNSGNADAVCSINTKFPVISSEGDSFELKKGESKIIEHTYIVQSSDAGKQIIYSIDIQDTLLKVPEVVTKESNPVQVACVVTFFSDGGSSVETITHIMPGSKIAIPPEPIKPGYEFCGWFDEDKQFDFATDTVTGDLTLTARWTKVSF